MRRSILIILFAFLLIVVSQSNVEAQCAMCKAVAETGSEGNGDSIGKGLNNGILYLMGVPYVLLFLLFRRQLLAFFKELFYS